MSQDKKPPKERVNRSRRSWFIFYCVAFSLLSAVTITALAAVGLISQQMDLVATLVQGLLSFAGVATVAYVGGSSVDYNGGVGNMFRRDPPPPPDDQYYDPTEEPKG